MQIELINIFYYFIIFGILLFLIKIFNKKYVFKKRKCTKFKNQIEHPLIIDNNIDEKSVKELYNLLQKYFRIKTCYLYPNDNMKKFYDLDSFELHENYENFIDYMDKKYKITVKLDDELIDIMNKMH